MERNGFHYDKEKGQWYQLVKFAGDGIPLTGSNVTYPGLTIADAPTDPTKVKDGDSFYAIDENDGDGQAYLYFAGQWRPI